MAGLSQSCKLSLNLSKVHKPQTSSSRAQHVLYFLLRSPKHALVAVSLSSQNSLSQALLIPAQTATNHRSLCSNYQVALGWAQTAVYLGLHQSFTQETPKQIHPVDGFRPYQSTNQLGPQMTDPKGEIRRHQSLTKAKLAL